MTKLPDEIENKLIYIVNAINGEVFNWLMSRKHFEYIEALLHKHLSKYLTHPTDEGIEKEEPTERYQWDKPNPEEFTTEVKPPTKDTIEKIEYLSREEIMVLRKTDKERFDAVWSKLNELVDTVNHQQEQIQQLLSGK